MMENLKILTWNANGLWQRLGELEMFMREQDIDICLISETHVKNKLNFKINGFLDYHASHPSNKARGGASIYIKECIKHAIGLKLELESMQLIGVQVRTKHDLLNISSIYCPPRYKVDKNEFTNLIKSLRPNLIIGGDLNAKHTFWGSRCISQKGRALYEAGMENNCDFHSTGKPTYWPTDTSKIPDLIDFFVVRGIPSNRVKITESFDLFSDHSSVFLTLSESLIKVEIPPRLTNGKTNWEGFKNDVEDSVELNVSLQTPHELEDAVDNFVNIVQKAAWNNTPYQREIQCNKDVKYPQEIKDLVREKRKERRKWQQTRAPQYKSNLNRLCNLLKKMISDFKNREVGNYLESLTAGKESNYSLWKAIKATKKPKLPAPPIKNDQNEWAKSDKEKANVFANYLEETFKPFNGQALNDNINMNLTSSESFIVRNVTLAELNKEIKNLKPKKAPGYDLITAEILRMLPRKGLINLLYILNATLRLKYVPSQWKVAEVIMVLKPGKPSHEKKSYRPISLLPVISKVFERIFLQRLQPIIEEKGLIPEHQFGFRSKHSTIDQVHRITDVIEKALEEKKICSAVFLDVSQAFDKVWHDGLKFKLKQVLPEGLYKILKEYLENRIFRVRHGNDYSEFKEIVAGVPQGSVLGPTLYLLFTRDIPQTEDTIVATFADDTAILAVGKTINESTIKLQNALDNVNEWTKTWRLALNEMKSVHVDFTYKKINRLPLFINNTRVPFANEAKYLGMTLDAKLKWKPHVKKKCDELNNKLREMYWLLGRNSTLNIENKLLVYRQVLKPVWTYGIQLWGCTSDTNLNNLQTFENKLLRSFVNAPWYIRNEDLHRDLGIPTVREEIQNFARKHRKRLLEHTNRTVAEILDETDLVRRLRRTKPSDLVR